MAIVIPFDKLPAPASLTGSEKQIAWADQIRTRALQAAREFIESEIVKGESNGTDPAKIKEYGTKVFHLYQDLLRKSEARWWIDRRGETYGVAWLHRAKER